ncbi:copper resistance protein B [Sphingomonas abietis]|uniref:Copper resistance protein B n=2 Tax=Sphingomonas abietis TaxID=3012344 RepID=A0ABY7NVA6_9SPHN|nr:copper resistance protein B [Sphingomonas abietis]WBO24583.1 copper resistance protein B [Sphingomonas abietis]
MMPGMSMPGMSMPGMAMPKSTPVKVPDARKPKARKRIVSKPAIGKAPRQAAGPRPSPPDMAMPDMPAMPAHDMADMAMPETGAEAGSTAMPMAGMAGMDGMDGMDGMGGMATAQPSGSDLPAGQGAAPTPPQDHYADRLFPVAAMDAARKRMMREEGGQSLHQLMLNLAEWQIHDGRNGYRWDGEGWFGGDIDRIVVKSEGEGTLHRGVDEAEVQALYSRAIGPYFDLQAGVRHDFQPSPTRTYATIGVEGLAPYMFETEAALFLSTEGDVLARAEGWLDQRLTQRLILQPRVELNFAVQDMPEDRIGAGLSRAELGLRLRYEISRPFAPYIGVSYDAKVGRTARFARRDGEGTQSTSLVLGARTWF